MGRNGCAFWDCNNLFNWSEITNMKTTTMTDKMFKVINYVLLICIVGNLCACGSAVGWETKFGVYPITSISDTRGTSPENYEKIQRVNYAIDHAQK